MLRFVQTNVFGSPAQTIVNTVNTVGVMGKGIAKEFKRLYPSMFSEYAQFCSNQELTIGALHVWRGANKWVLNFPTKTTWRKPSKLEYIERGLHTFRSHYATLGIRSISFPPLGCGNGELEWSEVKPLMIQYLHGLDIPVWVHELFFNTGFEPEQKDLLARMPPSAFDEFAHDVRSSIIDKNGQFLTWSTKRPFRVRAGSDNSLDVFLDDRIVLDEDFLAISWVGLRLGLLTPDYFGPEPDGAGDYILPILSNLPYVRSLDFEAPRECRSSGRSGLMFNQGIEFTERVLARA